MAPPTGPGPGAHRRLREGAAGPAAARGLRPAVLRGGVGSSRAWSGRQAALPGGPSACVRRGACACVRLTPGAEGLPSRGASRLSGEQGQERTGPPSSRAQLHRRGPGSQSTGCPRARRSAAQLLQPAEGRGSPGAPHPPPHRPTPQAPGPVHSEGPSKPGSAGGSLPGPPPIHTCWSHFCRLY